VSPCHVTEVNKHIGAKVHDSSKSTGLLNPPSTMYTSHDRSAGQTSITSDELHNSKNGKTPEDDVTTMIHVSDEEGVHTVHLDKNNMVHATLPSNEKLLVLCDSGASSSIVCSSLLQRSRFLSQLPKYSMKPVTFTVGNGETVVSNQSLEFPIKIGIHKFVVQAMVVGNLGGIDLVIGQSALAHVDAKLSFKSNKLEFKSRSVLLYPSRNFVVNPKQTRYITVTARLPKALKNACVRIRGNKFFCQYGPEYMLVKFRKSEAVVIVRNDSNSPIVIEKTKSVGTVELQSLLDLYDPVTHFTQKDGQTTLHFYASQTRLQSPDRQSTDNIDYDKLEDRDEIFRIKSEVYGFLEPNDSRLRMRDSEIIARDITFDRCVLDLDGQQTVRDLLIKYKDSLSLHGEVGKTNLSVDFKLSDESPFYIRPFTVAPAEKVLIDKELEKLVKMGILEEGTSQYSSPVMLLRKKDTKSRRLVSDLRFLNQRILKRNYPFPLIKDALQIIGHSKAQVMSVLDLKEAYHCLNLTSESSQYCGITSYFGGKSYVYKKLPMGLSISPSVFQETINNILAEIQTNNEFCIGIMDDLIVFSRSIDEHLIHVEKILSILQKYGLKISPSKAKLFRNSVKYMGHEVLIKDNRPCIKPLKDRTEAIRRLPMPNTKRKLKGFIGQVAYLSQFLPNLQVLLQPLHAIAAKKADFIWTEEARTNYDKIVELLVQPPVLNMPISDGMFRLYCDTSKTGVGASLWQIQNKEERLIGYYSKALPKAAVNYGITELELSGLEIAISAFRHLLRGVYFECYTDHAAITQIMKSKHEPTSDRIKRLLEKLSSYCFKVGYRKGSTMVICDYLSRNPPLDSEDIAAEEQVPIAFPVTRRSACRDGIEVPSIQESVAALDRNSRRTNTTQPRQPQANTERQQHPVCDRQPTLNETPNSQQPTRERVRLIPTPRSATQAPQTTLVDPRIIPPQLPVELEDDRSPEMFETYSSPTANMVKEPAPLFGSINDSDVTLKHMPKQADINRMLEKLKKKVLQNYHLPHSRREIAKLQASCPDFKDIYNYIEQGFLPAVRKAAKRVVTEAENYMLIDKVLFKIKQGKENSDYNIVLAVPRVLVSDIISLYHDSLLSCHQGVVRVAMTIKQKFHFPISIKEYLIM
jgi:rhodanese-related sulfurtransferase